jgi:hypothetical protein
LRIATQEALRLYSLVEEYEAFVSDLLAILAYLTRGSEHASKSSTDTQSSGASASTLDLG